MKENRTLSELVREALRQYEQKQESPINHDLIAALRAVQESAKQVGLDKLTERNRRRGHSGPEGTRKED